jgi:catechol 2,3-dioxygenase-like lactoylglutathione lyase family enzyme
VATARYLVSDVEQAIAFYTQQLGFELIESMVPAFAIVRHGDLSLWLSGPKSSAARTMPDGARPEPGGWNRVVVEVDDLAARVAAMQAAGVHFRNEIVSGPGGKQILADDTSGNVVELFEAR